ncbi:MAG: pyridoxal-phosphate dependent enzyme [Anaerolineales bacterium]|nr:pyridoxal-phosphate dependent enzyme [Anaerolineales bacterium]
MFPSAWLQDAENRIQPFIHQTPLSYDPALGIYLKWENQQVTGSFKVRGALNKVLTLSENERSRGLVAASAGNHGLGVALAGQLVGAPTIIFSSEHAVPYKVEAMRLSGADVHLVPGGYGEAELAGLEYARTTQAAWISPYNDTLVIAGQGTLGLEIQRQLPPLASPPAWIVPAGGGGLMAGIGAALESGQQHKQGDHHKPRLIGVQSEASPFLHAIFHTGSQEGVTEFPSLADGLAGPVEKQAITIQLMREFVDEFILVSEDEIRQAIAYAWREYGERIEGSAAVALASVLTQKVTDRPAIVVISGGNIQPEIHAEIVGV